MVDQVKVVADDQAPAEQSLRRNLTNRHIQLIAIGGAIGTGLFMGSGKTISLAGPSIIFVYMIIGFMLFFVMRAMGELLLSNLEYKSFSDRHHVCHTGYNPAEPVSPAGEISCPRPE